MNIADIEPYDISKEFVQLEFRMRVSAPFDMHTEDVVGDRFMQLVQADILLGEEEKKVGEAELYWLRKGEIEDRGGDIFEVADSIDADPFSMVEDLFDPDTLDLKDKIMDAYGPDFVLMGADVVLLQRLFIEPEYRGYGIGTQAVRTIKNYFATWCGLIALKPIPYDKDTGFRRDDRKGRNRLIKFYERFGFRRLAGEHMLLCTEVAQQPPVKETKPRPRAKKV